jgi:2-oxoglutarate/2-oxoacid ferredoxin oxidoreductase subunit beta
MEKKDDFLSDYENQWCPGCGNFGILNAMKDALTRRKIPLKRF